MAELRKAKGLSLDAVAQVVGTDQANLSRIEKGQQIPKRELARALFRYYAGAVSLDAIYDPEFASRPAAERLAQSQAP